MRKTDLSVGINIESGECYYHARTSATILRFDEEHETF